MSAGTSRNKEIILQTADIWRKYDDTIKKLQKATAGNLSGSAKFLRQHALDMGDKFRELICNNLPFEVDKETLEIRISPEAPESIPDEYFTVLTILVSEMYFWYGTWCAASLAYLKAAKAGEEPSKSVVESVLKSYENKPTITGALLEFPQVAETATLSLSGYVKANMRMYPRIKAALEEDGNASEVYFERLPANVFIAWNERKHGDKMRSFVARTSNLTGQPLARLARSKEEFLSLDDTSISSFENQFFLREEARLEIESLTGKAKLSRREAELLALRRANPDSTDSELADLMGVKEGTVAALNNRIKTKLKLAANRR